MRLLLTITLVIAGMRAGIHGTDVVKTLTLGESVNITDVVGFIDALVIFWLAASLYRALLRYDAAWVRHLEEVAAHRETIRAKIDDYYDATLGDDGPHAGSIS
jgi:hypothetical protein